MAEDYLRKLVDTGRISEDQLREAEEMASSIGVSISDALIRLGYVSVGEMGQLQAEEYGHEFINLDTMEIPPSVIGLIPESVARENIVIPLALDEDRIRVAMVNVNDLDVIDKLRFMVNREIDPVGAPKESIQNAINRYYGGS